MSLSRGDFSGVIYDFDGVLVDTHATHMQARLEAFRRIGEQRGDERFAAISLEDHNDAHRYGSDSHTIIGRLLQRSGVVVVLDDEVIHEVVGAKREAYRRMQQDNMIAFDGAVEHYLDSIARYGSERVAICTTEQRHIVEAFLANELPDVAEQANIVSSEDVDDVKPDPEGYRRAVEMIGDLDGAYAIEDSINGVIAAKRAGLVVVAVLTTHAKSDFDSMHSNRPDYYAEQLGGFE